MKAWVKRTLALLAATCLLAGMIVALGEGLLIEDEAELISPVPEEIETDLWTEDMETTGEQAVMPMEWTDDLSEITGETHDPIKMEGLEISVYPNSCQLYVPNPNQLSTMTDEAEEQLESYSYTRKIWIQVDNTWNKCEFTIEDPSVLMVDGQQAMNAGGFVALKPGKTKIYCQVDDLKATVEVTVKQIDFVQVDEAHFPDPQFREFLAKRFTLVNGSLIPKETADSIEKKLDSYEASLTSYKIADLKGLEYFPNLRALYCDHFKGTSVDLSKNTKLEIVNLAYSYDLQSLNLNGCANLEGLQVTACSLNALDVSQCPDLYVLVCDQNKISSLNVTNCTRLRVLKANYNKLTSLDVSHCPELLELYCSNNQNIEFLNITGCPTLIRCFENDGILNEDYSYTTVRGNSFLNNIKILSYDTYKTSIRIGDVVHAHLTPTVAPTAASTAKPTAKPTATPTAKPPKAVIEEPSDTVIYKNGVYKLDKSGSYATFVKPAISAKTVRIVDTVTINSKKVPVMVIAAKAFYKDKKLITVTIGKNVWDVGANAFYGCVKLKTVKGGAAMDRIGKNAFRGCVAMTAFTLNKQVSIIGDYAFYGCSKLKVFNIKTLLLQNKYIGKKAFGKLYAQVTFKCPKKKLKAYKALLKKKGAPKKAKYKTL